MALGSILRCAMVAVALAFGISALVAPMMFAQMRPHKAAQKLYQFLPSMPTTQR
jgi:hypothetical protein